MLINDKFKAQTLTKIQPEIYVAMCKRHVL